MARVSYEVPNTLGGRKYDAPPKSVITDESPPDTSFGYATLPNRVENKSNNLSDILSSMCIDDDQSNSKRPIKSGEENFCLDELSFENIVSEHSREHLNSSSSLSDMLFSICIDDDQSSSNKNPMQSNSSSLCLGDFHLEDFAPENSTKHLYMKSENIKSKLDEGSLFDININDLIEDVNTKSSNFSLKDKHDSGFSFFSNSENQLTFAEMLDDTPAKNIPQHEFSDVSMLDLYNSLQSSKEMASESNSSSSDEIEDKNTKNLDINSDNSDQDSGVCGSEGLFAFESNSSSLDDDPVMGDIDLSSCIKSFEDKASFDLKLLVADTDVTKSNLQTSPEHLFHDASIFSLPLRNISSQAPRRNLHQSLFSKALSCKPKTDPRRLLKVANIKAELLNKVFGRVVPVEEKKPRIEAVTYSDKYISKCDSRRAFGQIEIGASPLR